MTAINKQTIRKLTGVRVTDPRSWQARTAYHVELLVHESLVTVAAFDVHIKPHLWQPLVGPEVTNQCRSFASAGCQADDALKQHLVDSCSAQLVEGHERPMVILFTQNIQHYSWLVVTPAGLLGRVVGSGDRFFAVSCRFPDYLDVFTSSDRPVWKSVANRLVWRFSRIDPETKQLYPRRTLGRLTIDFVTPETWGFASEIPGSPWRGRFGNWGTKEQLPCRSPKIQLWKKPERQSTNSLDPDGESKGDSQR